MDIENDWRKGPAHPGEVRLIVGVPSMGTWDHKFGMCLAAMCAAFGQIKVEGFSKQSLMLRHHQGSILPKARHNLLASALEVKATHLLFLDSDMTFPPLLAHYMLKANRRVLAANCPTKQFPPTPTARGRNNKVIYSQGKSGFEKVWRIGCAVMMLDLSIFEKIPAPWFGIRWAEDVQDYVGEDWWFCEILEKAGVPIFIDHSLSLHIGHVGRHQFRHSSDEVEKTEEEESEV